MHGICGIDSRLLRQESFQLSPCDAADTGTLDCSEISCLWGNCQQALIIKLVLRPWRQANSQTFAFEGIDEQDVCAFEETLGNDVDITRVL
jgi:hypothetical protein